MRLTVDIPEKQVEALIRSVMDNYPEAGTYSCLKCWKYNYDDCVFSFHDEEEGEDYTIGYKALRNGFDILINLGLKGEFNVYGWDPKEVYKPDNWDDWAGDWDAEVADGLVQCAIFGDVIYG